MMTAKLTKRRFMASSLTLFGGLCLLNVNAFAAEQDDTIFQKDGLAINGYDTVAYFTQNEAIEGKSDFVADYKGAIWQFATAKNRDMFLEMPEKYAPQFEGYCAYAAANGSVAKTEPDQWSIVDGKLYLNYNFLIKLRWDASQADFIKDANQKWPDVRPGKKNGRPL